MTDYLMRADDECENCHGSGIYGLVDNNSLVHDERRCCGCVRLYDSPQELEARDKLRREAEEKYDKLVNELRHWCDQRRQTSDHVFIRDIERMLPPRPPRYEEVPWHEAIEGLASDPPKYKRAQPIQYDDDCWAVRDESGSIRATNHNICWIVNGDDLGTWVAELA